MNLNPSEQAFIEEVASSAVHKAMTELNIHGIVEESSSKAVRKTLTELGFDVHNPIEVQKDAAALRSWRHMVEVLTRKLVASTVWMMVLGVFVLILMGVQAWMTQHGINIIQMENTGK